MKRNALVKMSNALARCTWDVQSVWAPRILAAVAAQIKMEDEDFHDYEIKIADLIQLSREKSGNIYTEISRAIDLIFSKKIIITTKNSTIVTMPFSSCEIDHKKGTITARFDKVMKPHYLQLKRDFTVYGIEDFLSLHGIYAQKIFQFLISWRDHSSIEIGISELHDMVSAAPSQRKDFRLFRTRVLDIAQKDILNNTKLWFRWEPIRQGRRCVAIRFILRDEALPTAARAARAVDDHARWQRLSEACWQRHRAAGTVCKPGKGQKCRYCTTRGRWYIAYGMEV